MEMVKYEVQSPKEIHELGVAIGNLIGVISLCLEDGFQPISDVPAVVIAAVKELSTAVNGVQEIPREVLTEPVLSVLGVVNPVAVSVRQLLK
jgi:hypothetical protein